MAVSDPTPRVFIIERSPMSADFPYVFDEYAWAVRFAEARGGDETDVIECPVIGRTLAARMVEEERSECEREAL